MKSQRRFLRLYVVFGISVPAIAWSVESVWWIPTPDRDYREHENDHRGGIGMTAIGGQNSLCGHQ